MVVFFIGKNMATIYKDTITNVLQIVSDLRGESSANTSANRVRAVSRSERDVAKRKFWRLFLLREQTAGTGDGVTASFTVGSSTYQMRDKGLYEVFVGGYNESNRYTIVDHTQFQAAVNQNASARLAYQWYDAANDLWKVRINPIPSTGDVVYYSYFWVPAAKTSATDYVYCFDMKILAHLANADIYEGEEEPDMSLDQINKAEVLIASYEGVEEAPAINQVYQMQSVENRASSRGIGSY